MNILSKDAILAADDLPRETVNVPEWGGEVLVRTPQKRSCARSRVLRGPAPQRHWCGAGRRCKKGLKANPFRRSVFRLALALGMPVRELLARVGSDELTEWMAFYQLEPFGEMRADLRSGVVAATFANAHRTKDARAFTPEDFMPYIERTTPKDDARLNVARFKAMFSHKVKKHG